MGKKVILEDKSEKKYIKYLVPLLIIIAALYIYNTSLEYNFLDGWDDTEYLTDPGVQEGDAREIFSNYHLGMYQPLPVLSLAMNYRSAGVNAQAYHATNLFLHVINIFLVWLLLLSLSKRKTIAGIGAFLFALHPMNVEAVVWISARSTLLFTAFYVGGLITYLKYSENKKPLYFGLTLLLAILAFFSKSLAMSFPFVLLVIDYYRGRTWSNRLWLEKTPFLALSIIFGFIAINAAENFGHITELASDYNLLDRFFILCHTYVFYLVKLIVPIKLSSIYAYPDMGSGSLPILYYFSAIIPLGLIYLIYRFWNKQREIIAGLLFFTFAIAPVLPLFWSRIFVAADRYAYLSFIGLFLIIGIIIDRVFSKKLIPQGSLKYGFIGILLFYGIFLGYTAMIQTGYWKTAPMLLYRAVVLSESSQAKALAYFYRGNAYQNIAKQERMEGYQSRNVELLKRSRTSYWKTVKDYDSTLVHNPEHMLAYANRGMVYIDVSQYDTAYRKKYINLALQDFNKAISLDPEYADNYYNLGWTYYVAGDLPKACELWKKADELGSIMASQPLQQYCK